MFNNPNITNLPAPIPFAAYSSHGSYMGFIGTDYTSTSAAAGIMFVMVSATIWHVMRGEISSAVVTLVLLVMATFVAYMRWRVHPLPGRSAVASRA